MKVTIRRSPLALALLALLAEEPMHPYRMQQLIKQRHKETVINVRLRASLYQMIERLLRGGLIEIQETEKADNRPERTIYRLTPEGDATARQWLREMLAHPINEFPEFPAAISVMPILPPEEVLELLTQRESALAAQIADIDRKLGAITPYLPRLFLLEMEHQRALLHAERKWLGGVITDLQSGALHWDEEWLAAQTAPPEEVMSALERI
jgi:DNA-binding PadR family transcriptional regulator